MKMPMQDGLERLELMRTQLVAKLLTQHAIHISADDLSSALPAAARQPGEAPLLLLLLLLLLQQGLPHGPLACLFPPDLAWQWQQALDGALLAAAEQGLLEHCRLLLTPASEGAPRARANAYFSRGLQLAVRGAHLEPHGRDRPLVPCVE